MTWNDYYTIAEKYYRRHGNLATPATYWCMGANLGAWLSRQRVRHLPVAPHPLTDNQVELLDVLNMDWEIKRRDWETCFGCAERYYAEHGNLRVLPGTKMDGINLYYWLIKQRQRYSIYHSGEYTEGETLARSSVGKPLTEEQISRLESIGMRWNTYNDAWERAFSVAERYYKEHGNLTVPKHYEEDGVNLSHWIWTQRRAMQGRDLDRNQCLTEEQVRRLESIGMVWAPKAKGFGYYYDQAKRFYDAYGHTDFPEGDVYIEGEQLSERGEQLRKWKHEQEQYLLNPSENANQQKRGTFATHRKLLYEIGINPTNWEIPWEKNYRCAESYYRKHGNLLVPYYYKTDDGIGLGKWISEQRLKKKRTIGALSKDQIERLEKIGMVWDTGGKRTKRRQTGKPEIRKNAAWDNAYIFAEKYYNEHGDLLVPKGYMDEGFHLYAWIVKQRHRYFIDHSPKYGNSRNEPDETTERQQGKEDPLTEEQIARLEAIGMVWNLFDYSWDRSFALAEAYYKEHGDLFVPTNYRVDGVDLYYWLQTQRRIRFGKLANRKSPLTDEQIKRLDSIGMPWQPGDARWERSFAIAEKYYKVHGNLKPPKDYEEDGVNLSHWIWVQRRMYLKTDADKGKRLTEEQIRRLESIGMDWAPKSKGFSYYCEMAKLFYDTYGNTDFPAGAVEVDGKILPESGEALIAWKERVQREFANKKYDMKWEQITSLREIGIIPAETLSPWEKNYQAAEEYYRKNGSLRVPFSYITEDGIRLGRWISTQRMKRNGTAAGKLSEEQIRRLDAIGMMWNAKEKQS